MRLSQRLLAAFLLVIVVLGTLVVFSVERRVRDRLRADVVKELQGEAWLVGSLWAAASSPDSLADAAGAMLSARVTLIRPDGVVVGDTEFDGDALRALENHLDRPEVALAIRQGSGSAIRRSPSKGDEEIYAAVRTPNGVARISVTAAAHALAVSRLQKDVINAALVAAAIALFLSWIFARSVSRPLVELTEDARLIAAGDLSRRPSISAPGEVGDLGAAFGRLAEQLSARVQALEADDVLLRAVFESLNQGVIAIDAANRVLHINAGARWLLGVDDPTPFSADRLPSDQVLRECIDAAMASTDVDAVETTLHDRAVSLTARPLSEGGAVVALFDVTPIRKLETMRRDFVANVSHELKTPLTVVSGFAETIGDEQLPHAQQKAFAATIVANTKRMQRLVDDLLDLSRIESGGWVPNPSTMDISSVAADILLAIRESASRKRLSLSLDIPRDAASVYADPVAFRQVLSNLVDNSVRHTATGSVTIFAAREDGGIMVGVRDTGSGIPPEHLPRVFERFYRVDAARSRQEGGTGLGLAIVKHLVENHGGRVSAESEFGVGTTISAFFPVKRG